MSSNMDKKSSINTISKEITAQLLQRILDGTYPAGSKLPTERKLAGEFGVTRHIIREALKRVEVMNLITIIHGSGIYIEDFNKTGCIDLADYLLLGKNGDVDLKFLKDIIEFHSHMAVFVVELAAQRILPEEIQEIRDLFNEIKKMPLGEEKVTGLCLQFMLAFIKGSHNKYISLMFNTAIRIDGKFEPFFAVIAAFFHQSLDYVEKIIEAVESKDPEMARLHVTRVIDHHLKTFIDVLDQSFKESV